MQSGCRSEQEAILVWFYVLVIFWTYHKMENDRNSPCAFVFMGTLNLMGMPNSKVCCNWRLRLILDTGVQLYYGWILSLKHFILINFVYSCVLKYRALNVSPWFAVLWSRHLPVPCDQLMLMAWAKENYCLFFCLIKFLFSSITLIYSWLLFL